MNRREMLGAVGASGLASISLAGCSPPDPRYVELRVSPKVSESPFTVEEFSAAGKSAGAVRADDERGLALFLTRTVKDAAAPKQVRLMVADGNTLPRVWSAVRVSKAAGIARVLYYGCVPPGCGVLTGATPDQKRHAGTTFTTEWLDQTLTTVSTYC